MMRHSSLQSIIIAAFTIALLIYFIRWPSSWYLGPESHDLQYVVPTRRPPSMLTNPYTDWWLVWQKEKHSSTLVIAQTKSENVSWLDDTLSDLNNMRRAVYVADDETAPLHPPANKGNEAMVYLSYILDFYDDLPDVSIFMHSHSATWHISDLLNKSSVDLLHRLSLEKVVREGYVNLRCDLDPGCPVSSQVDRLDDGDTASKMNKILATALAEIFPGDLLPVTLAQACCAQFALSRDAIRQHSKQYYHALQDWLITTGLPNQITGRIFEYLWHYLFTSKAVFCPSEHLCYCDAFAICFPSEEAWNEYVDILASKHAFEEEHRSLSETGNDARREELRLLVKTLHNEAETRKEDAILVGGDVFRRQKVLYDAWELLEARGQL